jgi:hypothetical protein
MAKTSTVINLGMMPAHVRAYYDKLDDTQKAHFLGYGGGARDNWDTPQYITTAVEKVFSKGNAFIVLGLDRPHNVLSGYGGTMGSHTAAIDIVAGRVGSQAVSRDDEGKLNYVDPNFQLDAARIYISQKSNVDQEFQLNPGTVGNTSPRAPRSTVAIKADTLRLIARESIKLVTKTDWKNSQGGELTEGDKGIYGIDLMAMNDDRDMQPLVKGENLRLCLTEIIEVVQTLADLFGNFVAYDRDLMTALIGHKHYSPFFGIPTSPSLDDLVPRGAESLVNKVTNVEAQSNLLVQQMIGVQQNYIDAPGGAETVFTIELGNPQAGGAATQGPFTSRGNRTTARLTKKKSLHILSKYNNTN